MYRSISTLNEKHIRRAVAFTPQRLLSSVVSASAKFEEEVTLKLREITDPATNRSIDSLGILQVKLISAVLRFILCSSSIRHIAGCQSERQRHQDCTGLFCSWVSVRKGGNRGDTILLPLIPTVFLLCAGGCQNSPKFGANNMEQRP